MQDAQIPSLDCWTEDNFEPHDPPKEITGYKMKISG